MRSASTKPHPTAGVRELRDFLEVLFTRLDFQVSTVSLRSSSTLIFQLFGDGKVDYL